MAGMYSPKHSANSAPRVQPFAGDNARNLQPQQFGSGTRASGKVKTGGLFSKGMHAAGKYGFNM
jgi:hypothetical protein